jgi:purine nucleosidase
LCVERRRAEAQCFLGSLWLRRLVDSSSTLNKIARAMASSLKTSAQPVWLDTDIGDDTDDILALSLICASPELELVGVSTVLGDTATRARLARTLLSSVSGRGPCAPVAAGCGHPWPGRVTPHLWPNGPVARPWLVQRPCARPAAELPRAPRLHGVDLLAARLLDRPGRIVPIGIGPMTNLATLLVRHPAVRTAIPGITVMAGEFSERKAEWNVRCDPLAAACVFASGIPMNVIPWSVGMACTISPAQLRRLYVSRRPTGRLLARAIRLWQAAKSRPGCREYPHLFDPMAVATVSHPEWFEWRRGHVDVRFTPEALAQTRFTPDANGPHRVAWKIRSHRSVEAVWARILSL